jgi:hypothetical protein
VEAKLPLQKELNFISFACIDPLTATSSEAKEIGVSFNQHNVHVNIYLFQNQIYWMPKSNTKISLGNRLSYRTGEYGSLPEGSVKDSNQYELDGLP